MTAPKMSRLLLCLLSVAFVGLTGCHSYRLGHPAKIPFETIFVQPAGNQSYAPQAQATLSANLREEIIRDGRVKLVADPSKADVILELSLIDYKRESGTRNPQDTEVALDYNIALAASISLYDQRINGYLFEGRQVEEKSTVFVNDLYTTPGSLNTQSLVQAEYQAIPQIARDLAKQVADSALGAW